MTDILRTFPIATLTDRDAEVPLLRDFVQAHGPFQSILDIGAHCSAQYYAPMLAEAITDDGCYWGVDVLEPDPATLGILDRYFTANAVTDDLPPAHEHGWYELVTCVSTIEHAGVSTYKRDDITHEQDLLFEQCMFYADKWMWISFPVGRPYVVPGELSVITADQLDRWIDAAEYYVSAWPAAGRKGGSVRTRFVYNERGPQAGTPWVEHDDRAFALDVQYVDEVGNQSICVLEIAKAVA